MSDGANIGSLKRAGVRLVAAAAMLGAVSLAYFLSDEIALTYRELDGYLPVLPIVRMALAIVAAGLFFALAYPAAVLAARAPFAARSRAIPAYGLRLERALNAGLTLVALVCAFLLVRQSIPPALLPFTVADMVSRFFAAACLIVGTLLLLWLLWELRGVVIGLSQARQHAADAGPPMLHVGAASPASCPRCGVSDPARTAFCRNCGARIGT